MALVDLLTNKDKDVIPPGWCLPAGGTRLVPIHGRVYPGWTFENLDLFKDLRRLAQARDEARQVLCGTLMPALHSYRLAPYHSIPVFRDDPMMTLMQKPQAVGKTTL